MRRLLSQFVSCSVLAATLTGCQTSPLQNAPWSQPSRVPPPNAPSVLPTAPYANPGQPGIPAVPGNQPKPGTASQSFGSAPPAGPLYDGVAAAQNELKLASDSARAAVERSTNAINSGVYQAGARLDRIGSGVVQATGILESSISGPLPTGASGSLSDMPKDAGDLQWRKPQ